MKKNLLILFVLAFTISCKSQKTGVEFPIQDFEFNSIFGSKKNQSEKSSEGGFCLLGTGFF